MTSHKTFDGHADSNGRVMSGGPGLQYQTTSSQPSIKMSCRNTLLRHVNVCPDCRLEIQFLSSPSAYDNNEEMLVNADSAFYVR